VLIHPAAGLYIPTYTRTSITRCDQLLSARWDNKEAGITSISWMLGYPMQIKVDFLCRDSILAAPIALILFCSSDLAKRTPQWRISHSGVA